MGPRMAVAASRLTAGTLCALLLASCASNNPGPPPATISTPRASAPPPPAAPPRAEPAVSKELFEGAIRRMVAPEAGGAPVDVIAIAGPVRGWAAVAVSPPYREFPTVVLFRAGQDGSWSRVFEGLLPGVQPKPSGVLDLHTRGQAFDYTLGSDGVRVSADTIVKAVSISRGTRLVTVAHAFFIHAHPAGEENYFVDRTATYDLARRLFPGEYEKYPRSECTMFDVPALRRIELKPAEDHLVLTAQTDNAQTWVISWTGVDDRGFLTDKTVDAK